MSTYDATRIEKPKHFRLSPLRRGRGDRRPHVIGFDSEASKGKPILFQFSRFGDESDVELRVIPERRQAALDTFATYIHDYCTRKDTEYLIVGWNLKYEFTQLFGDLPDVLNTQDEYEFVYNLESQSGLTLARYTVRVMNEKRFSAVFVNEATKRRVRLMDGMAFYVTSLNAAAEMLGLGAKLAVCGIEHPSNKKCEACERRKKNLTRADLGDPTFLAYARQDAYLTRKIGEEIIALHERFDVPTCITAPHFAARVFRRHFLNNEIPLPSLDLEQAGLFSYHGGKNGYYLDGPMQMARIWSYDITSAYPEAMRQLPNVETAEWHWSEEYHPNVAALWRVTMRYKSCRWRGIMKHENAWCQTGYVEDTWTTSYELDAAIAQGEVELISCVGWVMTGDPGGPLVTYVDTFFREKREAEGAKRAAAKLFLNSLYGKFFQKVPLGSVGYWDADTLDDNGSVRFVMTDPTQTFDFQAGGLYHPPIASLITGYVRAKIHTLEHRYKSVMTSTDGFFALEPPMQSDIGDELGKLTAENGALSIWRERLYDFKPKGKGKPKYALHGFRGTVDELRKIPLKRGAYQYRAQQVITNKLALKSYRGVRYSPGTFAELRFTLDLTADAGP